MSTILVFKLNPWKTILIHRSYHIACRLSLWWKWGWISLVTAVGILVPRHLCSWRPWSEGSHNIVFYMFKFQYEENQAILCETGIMSSTNGEAKTVRYYTWVALYLRPPTCMLFLSLCHSDTASVQKSYQSYR